MAQRRLVSPWSQCVIAGFLVVLGTSESTHAQQGSPPRVLKAPERIPMRDPIREEEVRKIVAKTATMDAQMAAKTKPLPEVRPNVQSSLLTSSIVLSDGEAFTLVPVGSVLHLPPSYRNRVLEKPEGTFTFWPAFLAKNTSWLTAKEVPLKMAKGDAKAGEAIMRAVSMEPKVVVSVYKGGPISILEPVPGSENSNEKATGSAEADGAAEQVVSKKKSNR
jgi:hypothetical protein